jgi:uncharacterized iron-regulated protein
MKIKFLLISLLIFSSNLFAQDMPAYALYNSKGKKVKYQKMLKILQKKDIVFFGELHNNPISHWLQLKVTQDLYAKRKLLLGAEMFEADNQQIINKYLLGEINRKALDTLARLWPNQKTDYDPLLNFAKKNQLEFIATNIPRKYASCVHKKGFEGLDSLNESERNYIAPLPIPFDSLLPTYQNILSMMGDHASPRLVKAQAIKDATMAWFITQNIKPNALFLHFNGAYHSDFYEGIVWYVKQYKSELKTATISTVTQNNVKKLKKEHIGRADFIICVDEQMTSTY